MTADEAAEAVAKVRAKVIVPMHFGTIVGSVDDAERLAELSTVPVEILRRWRRLGGADGRRGAPPAAPPDRAAGPR